MKNFKKGWKHGAGADIFKRGGGAGTFPIFSRFINFTFKNDLPFAKLSFDISLNQGKLVGRIRVF